MNKKKIGIITMHKVWNFGSALQAYATQYILQSLGNECELIDYKYPNLEHSAYHKTLKRINELTLKEIIHLFLVKVKSSVFKPKTNLFEEFYTNHFNCTSKTYNSRCELLEEKFDYDVYLTGSDQVWNPNYIGFDTSFMLDFAPKSAKKVSYASSFTLSVIPEHFRKLYAKYLKEYDVISVRETSGQTIVKSLTEKEATVVCDPTLLLNAEQWMNLAEKSVFKTDESYLLVYIMGYAYDPYPEIYNYIERINSELKLPVIYINAKPGRLKGKYPEIKVEAKGPNEFLYLLSHASFIITDSFHGTAFSLNFGKRFISCVKDKKDGDSRIWDLIRIVGADNHCVIYNKNEDIVFEPISETCSKKLAEYRQKSIDFLKNSI